MDKNEEYVRSVWLVAAEREFSGHIWLSATTDRYFESWLEAAEFTRERLEQVRQVEEEILRMRRWIAACGYSANPAEWEAVPEKRILARLEAELARLTVGRKKETL